MDSTIRHSEKQTEKSKDPGDSGIGRTHVTPEALRDDPSLSREEKIERLTRWAYDDSDENVATEEGMPLAGDTAMQRRILLSLRELGVSFDTERIGSSKQHGRLE